MIRKNTQGGQVIIINTILFFALSVAIIFAVTSPVISSLHVTKSFFKSNQAFLIANSAASEALYKLNGGKNISSTETITLSQGTAVINISDTADGKTISIDSDVDSYKRNYEVLVSVGEGVSFNYGLQIGHGGFEMAGTSKVVGNVYSNGNISGNGGAQITGSAVSANISSPVLVINNTGVIEPVYKIDFGGSTTPQDFAQSFTLSADSSISSIRTLIKKSDSQAMNNVTIKIVENSSGKPSKTVLASAVINAPTITTTFNYLNLPLSSSINLNSGDTYWIVFDTTAISSQYYSVGANDNVFNDGFAKTSLAGWAPSNGGTWLPTSSSTLDSYFDVYSGGSMGLIDGVNVGELGIGEAWSYEINNSTVAGNVYCQIGVGNNKSCDISKVAPVPQPWPVSEGNIIDWKKEGTDGGATTTISLSGSTKSMTIGPIKINGDLDLSSGATLNVEGTVYVTGDITITSNAVVKISPSLGTKGAVIVSDGNILTNGGGQFQGSGAAGSYVLVVTTSPCPDGVGCSGDNAIDVTGGTGAVGLNAQKGTIEFGGGAQAKQVTGNKVIMGGGSTITYESGLANPNFVSGPSGSWKIDSWKEVE